MARKRQIDPDIWTSVQFMGLKHLGARLLFIGMITQADDEGRLRGDPLYLKAAIFPSDRTPIRTIQEWRADLERAGLIAVYQAHPINGQSEDFIFLPTFKKHQYMTKAFPSKLPAPNQQVNDRLITDTQPVNDTLHGILMENNGTDIGTGNEDGINTATDKPSPPSRPRRARNPNPDGRITEIAKAIRELRGGDDSPKPAAEAKAAAQMLRGGHSPPEIVACFCYMSEQPFWQEHELLLTSVAGEIAKWKRNGKPEHFRGGNGRANKNERDTRAGAPHRPDPVARVAVIDDDS